MRLFLSVLLVLQAIVAGPTSLRGPTQLGGTVSSTAPGNGNSCVQTTTGTSMGCTLTIANGSGVVVGVAVQSTVTVNSVTDDFSVNFTQDANSPQNNAGNGRVALFYLCAETSGSRTVTANLSGTPNTAAVMVQEVTNMLSSGCRDTSAGTTYSSSSTPSAGNITTSQGDLLFGVVSGISSTFTFTATNSYTLVGAASQSRGNAEYRVTSASGTFTDGWSLNTSTSGAVMLGAFK